MTSNNITINVCRSNSCRIYDSKCTYTVSAILYIITCNIIVPLSPTFEILHKLSSSTICVLHRIIGYWYTSRSRIVNSIKRTYNRCYTITPITIELAATTYCIICNGEILQCLIPLKLYFAVAFPECLLRQYSLYVYCSCRMQLKTMYPQYRCCPERWIHIICRNICCSCCCNIYPLMNCYS
jgi:hypothetical protein